MAKDESLFLPNETTKRLVRHLRRQLPKPTRLQLSVFDDGLVSKWDHALPRTKEFIMNEGCPVTLTLTSTQLGQLSLARQRAAKLTGYTGKVKVR